MAQTLDAVNDKSTVVVTMAFTDAAAAAVTPDSIVWSLTDDVGTIINSRENVSIGSPAASVDVVLSGNDTAYADGSSRIMSVYAVYDSDEGNDLPLRDEATFPITNLINTT